jgi:hypothetical protein
MSLLVAPSHIGSACPAASPSEPVQPSQQQRQVLSIRLVATLIYPLPTQAPDRPEL